MLNNKLVKSSGSVEKEIYMDMKRDLGNSANDNNASRSGVVESGKIFIRHDERGGGERGEGLKHSLMNTPHIDYHIHRFGANKSKAQDEHEVFPGSAKDGIFATTQGLMRRAGPAKDSRPSVSPANQTAKNSGARHSNKSRGENSKTYISSPSSSYNNSSCPPHSSNQAIGFPYFSAS